MVRASDNELGLDRDQGLEYIAPTLPVPTNPLSLLQSGSNDHTEFDIALSKSTVRE
jgi:hypothetical protein